MHRLFVFIARLIAVAAATALAAAPAAAQPSERAVKAAFLAKFGHYVVWPPRSGAPQPFNLCVIGKDEFGGLLDKAVAGQRIDGRPVAVHRLSSATRASGCHVAFVNGGALTGKMIAALRQSPVLIVTDARNGSARGMIHFAIHDGRVGFHINQEMANGSHLSISSRLLGLALSVKEGR